MHSHARMHTDTNIYKWLNSKIVFVLGGWLIDLIVKLFFSFTIHSSNHSPLLILIKPENNNSFCRMILFIFKFGMLPFFHNFLYLNIFFVCFKIPPNTGLKKKNKINHYCCCNCCIFSSFYSSWSCLFLNLLQFSLCCCFYIKSSGSGTAFVILMFCCCFCCQWLVLNSTIYIHLLDLKNPKCRKTTTITTIIATTIIGSIKNNKKKLVFIKIF